MVRDEIAARLASLSPAKRALLERRRRGEAPAARVRAIPRRANTGPAPLSFSQQRMWFLDQLEPGAPTYILRVLLRLSGPLDRHAVGRSFQEVVQRHAVLRTAFGVEADLPVQVVLPRLELALPWIDLTALPEDEREEEALRRARELSSASFDLSRPPLLRVLLIALDPSDHRLLVTMHHIVSDGWSMGVLVREVGALYPAFLASRPSPLPELPIQYADFAVWQRQWLAGELLERHLGYWRERLAGAPPGLDLPTDRPRPAVQSFRGDTCRFAFDAVSTETVAALARRENATPFMVFAAGLFALLSRLSGQSDLAIGSPIAGRNRVEIEELIGFFVNTLVLRADLGQAGGAGRPGDFLDLLRQVREVTLGAYAHQDLPFEELVAAIHPQRDLSRTPLFQVALALHNAPPLDATLASVELRLEELPGAGSRFDLSFIVSEENGFLTGTLEYATDLYDRTTAMRLCGHWLRLLKAAASDPCTALSRLELLSPAERHQALAEWNDTRTAADAHPEGASLLHEPFEQRVDLQPQAPAAFWEEESATYAELEDRANRLAHLLRRLGAGPQAPVGVWMDRSLDMLVALLGAAKAGAAYLPIDAGWPADRAEAVLAGTEAGIVLTRRARLPAVQGLQWRLPRLADAVCLDVGTPDLPPEPFDAERTRELWDVVSERAADWVTAAGFYSAYTGEPFSAAEVLEYRDRVVGLAGPWIGPDAREKRVLEIGCGSGLILWELAPRVGRYVGLDPSARTQERNRERAARERHDNVELLTGFAHEIETLPETPTGAFDLVILASTVQFFPGLVYLERVLELALSRLAPGGAVLVADVLDPRRREEFRRSLAEHAAQAKTTARAGGRPGDGRELYVDEGFFADLPAALPETAEVQVLHRWEGFPNELRFRYDVVIRKAVSTPAGEAAGSAAGKAAPRTPARRKRVWTGWHVAQSPGTRPRPVASPLDVAYVIHTSGSTGAPKGIVVQHRPAVALIRWINSTFGVGAGDRLLFITSPAFDLSVYDVFGVLGAGGAVQVVSESALRDPEELVRRLVAEPVTIWDSAPAALQQLVPFLPSPPPSEAPSGPVRTEPRLRLVLLSGDWIPVPLPDLVRASFPGARVISLGGATEATVWSNWYPIGKVDPRWPSIPYGRPIANARYHVLDGALAPCPIGVPGDLYIGGRCLCVGYARLPERTAERFIPDPFSDEPGARLYATGDRARYGRDGNLEFLGRVDQQVKVRGYRIELEEIEAVLAREPQVREAAVVARADVAGDKRLVAYVVPAAEPAPTAAELRAALQQVMPDYMVPATFVILERMPVTANGKLDRQALPAPQDVPQRETGYVAPGTETERRIAAIWQEVLGLPQVGIDDDFFELGGSSLVAAQVVSRIRQACAVEIPLRALFEARKLAGLAQRVQALVETGTASAAPPLAARPRSAAGTALPLSFAQQRLWFLDQLEPGNAAYNVPWAVEIAGALDAGRLRRTFDAVVQRHEVLRTTFSVAAGSPVQEIRESLQVPLPVVSLQGLPAGARQAEVRRLAAAEALRPFDLSTGPLLRSTLLHLDGQEHVLLLTLHHIVADGWSVGVLLEEVTALYRAFSRGEASPLPELPVQYADFALWQRSWLQGEALAAQLSYWRDQLAGAPPCLELATDRLRPASPNHRAGMLPVAFDQGLSQELAALGRREGATLFMTLLAAFGVLLGRSAGQQDVLVGSPIANRNRREIENLIGFFVNALVLRVRLGGPPSFRALLGRVRQTALDAYMHQDLPFERLVEELVTDRSARHSPLFQVMLALQNAPAEPLAVPGLTLRPLPPAEGVAKFDLTLTLTETAAGLAGSLEYDAELFDRTNVERLLARFEQLLRGVIEDPDRDVADLPLLLLAERRQLLVEWNDTRVERPRGLLIHELVAAQAAKTPGAPAVSCGAEALCYAELVARSNRLARHLRRLGVGPEVRVGICLERTPELVVGLLAALEAGGAYVPLDPSHPAERIAMVLEDAEAAVLVTEERWLGLLGLDLPPRDGAGVDLGSAGPAQATGSGAHTKEPSRARRTQGPRVVCLDRDREVIAAENAAAVPSSLDEENLAYVIYTSGSTGRPKGVQLPHRAVVNFLLAMAERPGLSARDVVPALTTIAFDIAGLEIYLPLLAGGRVEIVGRDEATDGERLAARLSACGATVVQATPATWRLLLDSGWPGDPGLKALCGGEALPRDLAAALAARVGALWNVYGPTETAIWSAAGEVAAGSGPVPLAAPIANIRFYVVDRGLSPVPIGAPGELWIGGDGLARGYLGRPELTAEKFVPDPFGGAPGARLYRTGDLVRYRARGELEFLGRIDHQVKVRGYRIELGEIEAALAGCPGVRECAVLAREDVPGSRVLVAYSTGDDLPAPGELRVALARRLPDYMVPSFFVALEAMPLTANGKLDRRALPAPERQEESHEAPTDPVEAAIADVWAELLGIERVGARDNFFLLGGHSLLGIHLLSRLRKRLGIELPLRRLFEAPTVAELARAVRAAQQAGAAPAWPAASGRRTTGEPLPLSHAQQRFWFLQQLNPASSAFNLSGAVRLSGRVDVAALEASFGESVRRHGALRTRFAAIDGVPYQIVDPPGPFALPQADLSGLAGNGPGLPEAELRRIAEAEMRRPFRLAAEPPLRVLLLRLADDLHVVLYSLHHIAGDGWSLAILTRELGDLYTAFVAGRPSPLPDLPLQYTGWAAAQQEWLRGPGGAEQLAYWRGQLGGELPVLSFPMQRQRPAAPRFRGAAQPLALGAVLSDALAELGRSAGATPFMCLLAAFQALLHLVTGEEDVLIGTNVANRDRPGVEGLIGLFINDLVLRTDLSGRPSFRELLARVRNTALEAYAHQDLPFEALLADLRPERSASRTPLFQAMFVLQSFPLAVRELPGLTLAPLEAEHRTANFDLTLILREETEGEDGISGVFVYDVDLFDTSTVARLAEHFVALVRQVAADPDRPLHSLSFAPEATSRELVSAFSEDL